MHMRHLTLLEKYADKAAKKAKEGLQRAKTFIRRRLDQLSQLQYAAAAAAAPLHHLMTNNDCPARMQC